MIILGVLPTPRFPPHRSEVVKQGQQQKTRQLTGTHKHWDSLYRTFCHTPGTVEEIVTDARSFKARPFILVSLVYSKQ